MDFNLETCITHEEEVTQEDVVRAISASLEDTQDIDGIYRLQLEEMRRFLMASCGRTEDEAQNDSAEL